MEQLELFTDDVAAGGDTHAEVPTASHGGPLKPASPSPGAGRGMIPVRAAVLGALADARIEGHDLTLTAQLERELYEDVNGVLAALGGVYLPRRRRHRFEQPAAPLIAEVLRSGHAPRTNRFDFFPTPDSLADTVAAFAESVIGWAAAGEGRRLLEPSAGAGQLVDAACRLEPAARDCFVLVEADSVRAAQLRAAGHGEVHEDDFLSWRTEEKFLGILMNPPFRDQAKRDIFEAHIRRAYELLEARGTLVAVLPQSILFGSRWESFRSWLAERSDNYELAPASAFAASGTNVATFVVSLVGRADAERMNTAEAGGLSAQEFRLWAALNNNPESYAEAFRLRTRDAGTRRDFLRRLASKAALDGSGLLSLNEPFFAQLDAYLVGMGD